MAPLSRQNSPFAQTLFSYLRLLTDLFTTIPRDDRPQNLSTQTDLETRVGVLSSVRRKGKVNAATAWAPAEMRRTHSQHDA